MNNKNNFVEYSKIYWDLGKASIQDTKDIVAHNASILVLAIVISAIGTALGICNGLDGLVVLSAIAFVSVCIVFVFAYRCDYEELTNYKNNVSKLEKNLGIDFNKFKENYVFLESYISSLKDNHKYITDMECPDYKFKDWQYIDIILNKFYNGIDKDYYNKLGKESVSLYGNNTLSLLDINKILGDDSEYSYNKVVNSLNK